MAGAHRITPMGRPVRRHADARLLRHRESVPVRSHIIRSKVRVPAVGDATVDRPRVDEILRAAVRDHPITVVTGAAGSGKTTAVAQYVRLEAGDCAWLTVDEAERSPSRLIAYLSAAIEPVAPSLSMRVDEFLADGLAPLDCAALLAEGLPAGMVLVMDDVHAVETRGSVIALLAALVTGLADDARLLLVARRLEHLDLSREMLNRRVARVTDHDLTLTSDEVAAVLVRAGSTADPSVVARRSGGWAAGVVFETLGADRPRDRRDPFFSYLGSEVLGGVPSALRRLLIASAVIELVTPHGLDAAARAIGEPEGQFEGLVGQALPGSLEEEGFRYHPRFREFLLSRLDDELPEQAGRVRSMCAQSLLDDGHPEEAADLLFSAGVVDEVVPVVRRAASHLMRRGDWDKLITWCSAIGEDRLARDGTLRGLQVRALMMSRRQEDVAPVVDRMRATGEFTRHVDEDPDVAAWAVWALHGAGDLGELLTLAPPVDRSPRCRSVRYILETLGGSDPPPPWLPGAYDHVQPLHIALQSAEYYRGRFAQLEHLSAAAASRGPVTATLGRIFMIAALTAQGHLARARRELSDAAPRVRSSRFVEFWQMADAVLTFEEGDHDTGIALIREARETSRRHGYRLADRAVFPAVEGKMLVRSGALPDAVELLDGTLWWCAHHGVPCMGEWAETWRAAALLGLHDDPSAVGAALERAIGGMRSAERHLEFVAALVFLAEARWRTGEDDEHDRLLDEAHRAAIRLGTLTSLVTAVDVFPDVVARRLESSDPAAADVWRRVALARERSPEGVPDAPVLVVRTIGTSGLETGSGAVSVPDRAVALAALVTASGASGLARDDALVKLIERSSDPAGYLRQIVRRLRAALPSGVGLETDDGVLRWRPGDAVSSDDHRLISLVARSRRETDARRIELLDEAVRIGERGPFLPGSDAPFVQERRAEVGVHLAEARRELAQDHLASGRAFEAERVARAAVDDDPYGEVAWVLLLRAEAAARGPSGIPTLFGEYEARLAEIGLMPSPTMEELCTRLRRGSP